MDELRRNFEKFIMSRRIKSDLKVEDINKIHSEIFHYCWSITPERLYRYRVCNENNFEAIINDQLLLTKPSLFNDPYDSLLYVNKSKIISTLVNTDGQWHFQYVSRLLKDKKFREKEEKLCGITFIDKVIDNSSINGVPIKYAKHHRELINSINGKRVDDIIDILIKSMKQSSIVACFSDKINSILMWSHYAANHKGFALGYDFKELYSIDIGKDSVKGSYFVDKKLFPVLYSNKRFDATEFAESNYVYDLHWRSGIEPNFPFFDILFYYKLLIFKSKHWEYESEWRIIQQTNMELDDNKPDTKLVKYYRPKEIYLGKEVSKINKTILLEIAKEKNIQVFQMAIDYSDRQYRLECNEIH